MNKRIIPLLLLILLPPLFIGACAGSKSSMGKKQYDIGRQLSQSGKYKEAVTYLEQAIANEPDNAQYHQSLTKIKEEGIDKYLAEASKKLNTGSSLTLTDFNTAKSVFAKAQEIDTQHPKVIDFSNNLNEQENKFTTEINEIYSNAKQYAQAEEWLKAFFNLQQVQNRFPNYEDSLQYQTDVVKKGSEAFYEKANIDFKNENMKGTIENLRNALSIRGDYQEARQLMSLARERDNKEYFIQQAESAVLEKKYDKGIKYYQQAITYDPEDADLIKMLTDAEQKAGHYFINKTKEEMNQGLLAQASESYESAKKYQRKSSTHTIIELRDDLCRQINNAAELLTEKNEFGSSWYLYQKIKNINSDYPQLFFLIQKMEDEITKNVRKSIAVFDFSSPTSNPDAGIIVANNLITFLFKTASGDIKILERESLKSILEQIASGQARETVVSTGFIEEMGQKYGIDIAIMGSMLLFKVDASSSQGVKTVRYKVGTKIKDNIEYLNWMAKHPTPTPEEITGAPPAKIMAPDYAEKDYPITHNKKIAFIQMSFRITDVSTGKDIQVKTLERKLTVEDEGKAGVPEANITFDPVEMPSDTELLQQITKEVVTELGDEILRPLQNLENKYFQEGEKHMRRKDTLPAAENFINALFDEKLKRIQDSPLTIQILKNLDTIFLNYKFEGVE